MLDRVNDFNKRLDEVARTVGTLLVELFHKIGLFVIGATTVWAATGTLVDLVRKQRAGVEDILLLFIFLEIGAMVGIYFKTNHMPVRFLFYVAITAATRHMIGVLNQSHHPGVELLIIAGAILILAVALLCVRYGSYSFPAGPPRAPTFDTDLDTAPRKTAVDQGIQP
jgi:protein PsiE